MKAAKILVLMALVSLVLFGAGCVGQQPTSTIQSGAEAGEAVTDIGQGVEDVSAVIEDVDTSLG